MRTRSYVIAVFAAAGSFLASCKKEIIKKPNVSETNSSPTVKTRVYYIAAVEQTWDYAPSGTNLFAGNAFDANDSIYAVNISSGPTPRIGRKYKKARYVEYTDSTFTDQKVIPAEWVHLGLMGPVIRANTGDSVVVYFKNLTTINTSFNVHGLQFDVNSNGANYNNGATGGSVIAPGAAYRYRYFVPESLAPASNAASSTVWLYHSMTAVSDMYAGLFGPIIVTKRELADENAKPIDVDREFVTMFFISDENASPYLQDNINTYCSGFTNPDPDDFEESNKKHCINGMFMGNLPGLTMNKGERVRWYLIGLGNEADLHTPHWMGNSATVAGQASDVISLLPATSVVADMQPMNPGNWGYLCHVTDHMMGGMAAFYTVNP